MWKKAFALVVLWVICFPLGAIESPQNNTPELLTTTVGMAEKRIVTSREVQIAFLLEKALYGSSQVSRAAQLSVKQKEFSREVNAVLLEWVVYLEALSFSAQEVSSADVDAAEKTALSALAKNEQWQNLGISKKEWRSELERKIRAKRFIQFKAKSSIVPVTDNEAQEYYEKNRLKFGNLPFEKFSENIKSFLIRQQVDRRLKDWFEVLQEKYKVKSLAADL